MDREHEHSDRAARGRRIFDALRRGRADGEPEEAAEAGAGEDNPATTIAVDDRPDDHSHSADPPAEGSPVESGAAGSGGTDNGGPPADPAERLKGAETDSAETDSAGEPSPGHEVTDPPAREASPSATSGGDPEVDRDEPDDDSDLLPGADVLRAHLGPADPITVPDPEAPDTSDTSDTSDASDGAPAVVTPLEAPPSLPDDPPARPATGVGEGDEPEPAAPAAAEGVAPPPSDALPRVIAIANQKGGVGKTTTAVNLGASLSELGYRVLIVDLDPQGNATTGLGIDIRNLDGSVYDSVMGDHPMEDCIEATSVRNLFVAPSNMDLAGAEIELVPVFSRELKLRRAIEAVKSEYEFILIDCPPSLGLLTVNGLAAADDVIVPIQCEYYALEGLGQLVNNVNLVRSNLNPVLDIRGIVLTMYDARTKLADQVVNEVRTHFGERCYETVVPRTVRLSEAPSFGQPIIVFDNSSRGSDAYRALAQEVAERVAGRPRDPVSGDSDRDD